jgi:CSLREA domain-containing protein
MLLVAASSASAAVINADIRDDEYVDNNDCSLREAVQSANVDGVLQFENACETGSGADLIRVFDGDLYTLDTAIVANNIETGDLEVTDPDGTTIQGDDDENTIIDGGDFDRVFDVTAPTGALGLVDLTVQNGQVTSENGAGILSVANVTLNGARVTANRILTSGNGGGIQVTGAHVLNMLAGSSVDTNVAPGTGGGIDLGNGGSLATSGGNVQISDNSAGANGGGVNLSLGSGNINVGAGTLIEDNTSVAFGGGISSSTGAALTINGATIKDNDVLEAASGIASGGGIHHVGGVGGLDITDSVIDNNTSTGDEATGGGLNINALAGTPSLTRTSVINNDVTTEDDADGASFEGGGGITLDGASPATITESVIADNVVIVNDPQDIASGAGIFDTGALTLDRTLIEGNDLSQNVQQRNGAGVAGIPPMGETRILNSTFSGNTLGGSGIGGGLATNVDVTHPLTIAHSTFTGNNAGFGNAINVSGGGAPLTVAGNVIDDEAGAAEGCFPAGLGGTEINGYNVDAGNSCTDVTDDTDLENTSSVLGPLATNGGPTQTHALLAGSPAIDRVPTAQCLDLTPAALTVDQRGAGFTRPVGAACDAGAFEVQPPPTSNPPVQQPPVPPPDCEPLRQQIKKLSKKIKKASGARKAKLKKKRRKARSQLRALGCTP